MIFRKEEIDLIKIGFCLLFQMERPLSRYLRFFTIVIPFVFIGCATETSRSLPPPTVATAAAPYAGPRASVTVGNFTNNSGFMQGIFSDGVDRLGAQARTILETHLNQSGRFRVGVRSEEENLSREAAYLGEERQVAGARYAITGSVTEFGRRTTGDTQLYGILGRGRQQVAYSKVMLNVVDVITSEVVYSGVGAGEYALSTREVAGFGGTAGYDATLNGKVLDLAIRDAVDQLARSFESGRWSL